jgi:hypothetical protein
MMTWYYEILGKDDEVLETSEPIYANQLEAQYAGYQRMKANPSLLGPVPISGKAESRLLSFLTGDHHIRAKQRED